jgi:hypothetical protein
MRVKFGTADLSSYELRKNRSEKVILAFRALMKFFPIFSTFVTGFDKLCTGNIPKVYLVIVRHLLWVFLIKIPSAFCQAKRSFRKSGVCVRVYFCLRVYEVIFLPQHQYKYRCLISFMFRSLIPRKELLVSTGEEDRCFIIRSRLISEKKRKKNTLLLRIKTMSTSP